MLEKLGVKTKKVLGGRCPKCKSKVIIRGGETWCPNCGTEPFEVTNAEAEKARKKRSS